MCESVLIIECVCNFSLSLNYTNMLQLFNLIRGQHIYIYLHDFVDLLCLSL